LSGQTDVAQRVEVVPAAVLAPEPIAVVVDEGRPAAAGRPAVAVRLPRPRPVQALDRGVRDCAEARVSLRCTVDRRGEAFGLPGAFPCRPGHGADLSTGSGGSPEVSDGWRDRAAAAVAPFATPTAR